MARSAKRAKANTGGPQRMGDLRSAATVRDIRFKDLSKLIKTQGPGQSEDARRDKLDINLDTKHTIFDFCAAMGNILFIDFFHPSAATLVKLNGLVDTLGDMMEGSELPESRKQISKAKKILKNYVKQFENLYYFESSIEEMVISLNSFFLDFGDKMQADVSELLKVAPRGQFA